MCGEFRNNQHTNNLRVVGRTEQSRVKSTADSHSNNSSTQCRHCQGLLTHLARLRMLRRATHGGSELAANPRVSSSLMVANVLFCVQLLISCLFLLNNISFLCREVKYSVPTSYFRFTQVMV